ncbi:Protein OS-9 [Cryptotrichosporon argae]
MRPLAVAPAAILLLLAPIAPASARRPSAQLQDPAAFPKYAVEFLNDLPLSAGDAVRSRAHGVGEREWLEPRLGDRRTLGEAAEAQGGAALVPLNYVHPDSLSTHAYLCLLPAPNATAAQGALRRSSRGGQGQGDEDDDDDVPDPAESWKALSHLEGRCLYLRQGWFTYSYCHDAQIRQFREARHPHPHPPGGYTPQEDPSYDAYTLGQARASAKRGSGSGLGSGSGAGTGGSRGGAGGKGKAALAPAERTVSFGLSPSSRYLMQRWADGTRCDKTGRARETEVQVHCSMTTSDVITMVKEVAICSYVVVIHSPHLCALPGFRKAHDDVVPAPIRCREVVSDDAYAAWERGETDDGAVLELPAKKADRRDGSSGDARGHGHDVIVEGEDDADLKALLVQSLQTLLDKSFSARPKGRSEKLSRGATEGRETDGDIEGRETDGDGDGDGDHEDVFILSLDGDEAEAILFDAETLLGTAGDDRGKALLARINRLLGLGGSEAEGEGDGEDEADEDGSGHSLPSRDEL